MGRPGPQLTLIVTARAICRANLNQPCRFASFMENKEENLAHIQRAWARVAANGGGGRLAPACRPVGASFRARTQARTRWMMAPWLRSRNDTDVEPNRHKAATRTRWMMAPWLRSRSDSELALDRPSIVVARLGH